MATVLYCTVYQGECQTKHFEAVGEKVLVQREEPPWSLVLGAPAGSCEIARLTRLRCGSFDPPYIHQLLARLPDSRPMHDNHS